MRNSAFLPPPRDENSDNCLVSRPPLIDFPRSNVRISPLLKGLGRPFQFLWEYSLFRKTHNAIKLHITSRHEDLSEALTQQVQAKIQRVERYLGQITEAHVILTYERNLHLCEVTLVARHLKLSAKATSRDMYNSIDAALERLEKQAKKNKEKRVEHRQAPGGKAHTVLHGLIPPASERDEFEVIRTKKHAVKPMTAEEAAMQLSSSKDEFLVFLDAETDKTCVVYKRKDHHIGLIEPEY